MSAQLSFDPLREANELRSQLASEKRRLAFLFGAGTSQSVGLDGMSGLTNAVREGLQADDRAAYDRLLSLDTLGNLETVLSRIRLCHALVGTDEDRQIDGLSGKHAVKLEHDICRHIQKRVSIEPSGGINPHFTLAHWAKSLDRTFPLELFTTNFDVLLERGLESAETPYFDGFVGTVEPFFLITAVDSVATTLGFPPVPRHWVRLWKLHGSLNWRSRRDPLTGVTRIVRTSAAAAEPDEELIIYPSVQKYVDSRRLPFLAYHDRLRHLVTSGETLLVIAGYSFSDQHLNEIIFQGLRSNSRLAVVILLFEELVSEHMKRDLLKPTLGMRNLTIYAPDRASLGGREGTWKEPKEKPSGTDGEWPFWDSKTGQFTLGDFRRFVEFLRVFMGIRTPDILPSIPPSAGSSKVSSSETGEPT